jgi:isoleucyl-tRNA synthetase
MWQETRLYEQIQKARQHAELFVLHDGPPFANGDVHMGTALKPIALTSKSPSRRARAED